MLFSTVAAALALVSVASAHFEVEYPWWRGDSFAKPASQYTFPCAGVDQTISATNRTAWPLTGGTLRLHVGHPWAYTYINLGMGNNVTSFNVSLVAQFNQTGNGTFCLPEVGRAKIAALNVTEGMNATLQVVQLGTTGSALYNCADITFTNAAKLLSGGDCTNTTGVGGVALMNSNMDHSSMGNGSSSPSGGGGASSGAAGGSGVAASVVVGLAGLVGVLVA